MITGAQLKLPPEKYGVLLVEHYYGSVTLIS